MFFLIRWLTGGWRKLHYLKIDFCVTGLDLQPLLSKLSQFLSVSVLFRDVAAQDMCGGAHDMWCTNWN